MDKNKNRTDLLAAGRKKLQQFRKKKDHKGAGGGAKSLGKAGRPEKDGGDAAAVPDDAAVGVDPPAVLSAGEANEGDSRSAVPSDHQEADRMGSEQCNGESLGAGDEAGGTAGDVVLNTDGMVEVSTVVRSSGVEVDQGCDVGSSISTDENCREEAETITSYPMILDNGRDKGGGCSADFAPSTGSTAEDRSAEPSLEFVSEPKSDVLSTPTEVSRREEGETTSSSADLEVSCSSVEDSDTKHDAPKNSEVGASGLNEETDADPSPQSGIAQQGNVMSMPVEDIQETGVNDSDIPGENVSHDKHLEVPPSTQESFVMTGEYGSHTDDREEGGGTDEQGNVMSIPVEEIQEMGMIDSDVPEENVSHDEHLEVPSSTQESFANTVQYASHTDDAEEGGGADEQGNVMSIQETCVHDSDIPEENVSHEEHLEVPSSTQDSSAMTGEYGSHTDDAKEGGGTDGQGYVMSIRVEEIQETGMHDSGIPEENVSHDEHLEVSSSNQKSFAKTGQYASHTDYVEEGGGTDEGGTEQSSVREDVVADSEPEASIVGGPISLEEEKVKEEDSLFLVDGSFADRLDSLRRHLYLTNVTKDFFQLQLAELINANPYQHSSDEVSKLLDLVKKTQESKGTISEELMQCKSELRAVALEKEKLENQCFWMKEEISQLHNGACELQSKLEHSQDELSRVSAELANYSGSLEDLQKENMNLAARLVSETDAKKKLMEENEKLASELLEQKDSLVITLNKQMQLEDNLRETGLFFEELAMENLYLTSSLVVHESKIKELDGCYLELPSQGREDVHRSNNSGMEDATTDNEVDVSQTKYGYCDINVFSDTAENSGLLQKDEDLASGSPVALRVLKGHLEEVENALDNLEKSIEGMHSHSVSLSRSGGKATAPGISKLIQAFESKTHHVDDVPDVAPLAEGGWSEDPYISVSKQVCSLKDTLKQMELDIGVVEAHLEGDFITRKNSEQLEMEAKAQRQQNNILQVKINDLDEKLCNYKSMTSDLQSYFNELQQSVISQSETFLSQVELLQKEVDDNASIVKQERESFTGAIMEAIEKLNAPTGLLVSEDIDIESLVLASADAATAAIRNLHEELEAAHLNYHRLSASFEELNRLYTDIQGRKDLAIALLNKYYNRLTEVVNDSCQNAEEAEIVVNFEEALPKNYEKLIENLQVLTDERLCLLSTNRELQSDLSNRNQETEELYMKCKTLDNKLEDLCNDNDRLELALTNTRYNIEEFNKRCLALIKKLEEHSWSGDLETTPRVAEDREAIVKCDNTENDFNNSVLSQLEALIAFHLREYEGIIEQIYLSKNHLREVCKLPEISTDCWSLPLLTLLQQEFVPQVIALQEKLQLFNASNLQLENEMHILREGLSNTEEALKVARSELHSKASELEQSEQRFSSVREKLSMAVAKGKALIGQRDSLKQSLTEKSSELERCTQELMSKEALLCEAEAKLKSCSEVERVESLESELSYIRNSATALRDSFLLKDSVLQRIEEVLEDLDLPEHFHSKDIIEKIELLARSVADNISLTMVDWDQKSSVGVSHFDSGSVVMDAWKDELPPSSNTELVELKRKHDELQRKLYGLAEHNDILEQSLLGRNDLVQKWEEVLNGIDMPSQLRTLEPEDRIEWLKRALAEVQQERDSLHLKIENLEVSSDMLIVDLEESHKKISELSAEVVAIKSEKEFFSESLDKLRYEYLGLSEKAVQDEIDSENLRKELDDLQEKMVSNFESKDHEFEKEMWRLHDLIINCLPDSGRFDTLSGGSGIEYLEVLLKNLIDSYTTLCMEKSMHEDSAKEFVSEEINSSLDKTVSRAVSDDKEQELVALKLELDEASHNMVLVKEERNTSIEKCHSLMLEIETISNQMSLLQEERTKDMEKYQTLKLELEAMIEQRDALQERLAQEEQNSVAAKKCESLMLETEAIRHQSNLLQEERIKDMEKYQTLVLELEATMKQRDALQELLTQEAQKSASAREKLNVAVRKGKGLVQQRDSLKQTIEEMNIALDHLKIEQSRQAEALESEKSLLINQLAETKHSLQDNSQTLNMLLSALHDIDVGSEVNIVDPVQKIKVIGKLCHELRSAIFSSEHEVKKSKRANELLLAELTEVQEGADGLQDELSKAISARSDALSRLDQFMSIHSEERKKQIDSLVGLKSGIYELRKGCFESSDLLSNIFTKDMDTFCYLDFFMESILRQTNGDHAAELPVLASKGLLSNNSMKEGRFLTFENDSVLNVHEHFDESSFTEHLALASSSLHECIREYDDAKENIHNHSLSIDQQATHLLNSIQTVQKTLTSQKEYSESLKKDVSGLELLIKEKETEVCRMQKNLALLYVACHSSITEIKNRRALIVGNGLPPGDHVFENSGTLLKLPRYIDGQDNTDGHNFPLTDDCISVVVDSLLSIAKGTSNISEIAEANQRELKAMIADLQREFQEKDIQMNRICADLVSQIREAETSAERSVVDLDSARSQVLSLEKQVDVLENDRKLLESRVNELNNLEVSSNELLERNKSLSDALSTKDQEIEALMEALDEEESQMEGLKNRNKQLENIVQEKNRTLESLEASRLKAVSNLSTTVNKFNELHNLSESFLAEIESLQSQLQGRDSDISFLRQEVTRCTNDILTSQETNKKYSSDMHELLKWMDMMVSRCGAPRAQHSDPEGSQIHEYTDILEKKIVSIMAELDDMRTTAESKESLLQIERDRVEELSCKAEVLESSLREKETHIELFQGRTDSSQQAGMNSPGPLEIEQVRDKVTLGPIKTHVRGGRKINNDHIAIAVDTEKDDNVLEDEDDDKAHGFKSLTMSQIVPRASRPIADRIDGIWVSGERLLMRQPTLRLGLIVYWVALHILLASVI